MLAASILRSPAAKPGTYTPPGGVAVPVRAVLNDGSGETRREAGEEFYAESALAILSAAVEPEDGGILTIGGTVYRIQGVVGSQVPGLLDCSVVRLTGPGVEIVDLGAATAGPLSELVVLDGRTVRATVARNADTIEPDADGTEIVVQRNRVAIRASDLGSASAGSVLILDGNRLHVTSIRRTAAGIIILIC